MKYLVILMVVLGFLAVAYYNAQTPDFEKINNAEVERCYADMQENPELVCD